MDLTNRVALVTGGSRGIGKAIVLHLAKAGAVVHATARKAESIEPVANAAVEANLPGKVVGHGVDVASIDGQSQLAAIIEKLGEDKAAGGLSILVNNAGITRDTLLMRMDDAQIDEVLLVNLRAAIIACRAAVPYIMRAKAAGRIINISSVSGVAGNAGQTNYSASKAGLIGLTKSLSKEIAKRGVTVNAVAPGFIETDMTDELPDDIKTTVKTLIPMARMGNADEIAGVVAFLASDAASYITGQVLTVDGGLHT